MVKEHSPPGSGAGAAVFRFEGFGDLPGAELGLPLVPIRVSTRQEDRGLFVNAVIDSGSTRTILPYEIAEDLSLTDLRFDDHVATAGGEAKVAPATIRLEILDSYFPAVRHWTFESLRVEVTDPSVDLPLPLIGWNVLRHFETSFHPQEGFLLLRQAAAPS